MSMFLMCIFIFFCTGNLYSQQVTREEVIASYIINFAKNIEWPNEGRIEEFHIVIISSDNNIIYELNKIGSKKRVKNKPIKISVEERLTTIDNVQLVFVAKDKEQFIEECFDKIEGRNILLITDNFNNKKVVMVNFYETPDQRLKFEINKANIINQNLTIMPDIVLLGGTEIDVAKLYRESQVSLRSMQKEMEKMENDLNNLQKLIDIRNMEINRQQEIINKQTEEFNGLQKQLIEQRAELQGLFQSAKRQQDILEQKAVLLEQREQELSEKSEQIQKSNEVLASQRKTIGEYTDRIKTQQKTIEEQGVVISTQQNKIYVLGVISVLILILIFTIYRGYKNKQKTNKFLEEEIAMRKHTEAALNKSAEELARSNKELESFAYSVSHDLRAPLRGIDGFSHILLDEYTDQLDTPGKNYLQRIRSATLRMSQLIDDMLSLSRVSRAEMSIQLLDLSKLAQEITNNLKEGQPERQVVINIQEGIMAHGDKGLLRIVLENLIGNAWKFTSKKSSATIEFGLLHQNNKQVIFVRDNGAGFDMKYAQKLFGAFQRLHDLKEFSGTGIGLATVQRIIHRHGGEVWAEGDIDKGATFYFTVQ